MKDRIAKSAFWMVWSRGALQFISFFSTLMVARLLVPGDYGLMALAGIWTEPLSSIAELGMGAAIIQFRDLEESELNACFWLTVTSAGLGYVTLYALAPSIATWFSSPRLALILRVAALVLPLSALRVVPDNLLRKRLELDKVSKAEIVAGISGVLVVLSMAWAGAGVWALVASVLTLEFSRGVVSFWFVRWRPGFRVKSSRFSELIRYSLNILGGRLCWVLYQQSDAFLLGKVSGSVILGFYSMAKTLALLAVEKVNSAVSQLAAPVMAQLQTNREALRASLLRTLRMVVWVTFPLCAGLLILAKDLVMLGLTRKWMPAVPIIQVLCLYAMIRSVATLLPPVLMARYRANFLFGYNASLLIVMPLAFFVGATWLGALGVAMAWVVVYPLLMTRMANQTLIEVDLAWKTLSRELWPPLAATCAMMGAMFLAHLGLSLWSDQLFIIRPVIMSMTGVAVYGAALLRFGGQIRAEMLEVMGWMFRRVYPQPISEYKA